MPLDGIRVLDLSRVLAGPYCTMLLADLGADVVKVERPGEGDETRSWGPPYADGESAYFLAVNRGKRSLALDLARPEGQEVARRLARSADVVVENFRRGGAERIGVGYSALAEANPGLVYCSISGFGDDRPGYDFVIQAESGLMAITGDGEPVKVGVAVVDVLAGYAAATAILAALVAGGGEHVRVSLLDVARSALANVAPSALVTGNEPPRHRHPHPTTEPPRPGNAHANVVPYQTFAASDAPVAVAAANDGLYRRLCALLERPDLADDDRFRTNPARVAHRDELVAELAPLFAARPAAEWLDRLRAAGVPAGKVRGVLESLGAPGATFEVPHPTIGRLPLVASPVAARAASSPPPLLGQHTRELLAEAGYDEEEVAALEAEGVVATSSRSSS